MPRKISAKKGTVRERTVDMRCGQVTWAGERHAGQTLNYR